MYLLHTQAQFT
ncbi:hypothetical protein Pint_28337 [Pistacia integerrima]|uniref:Uncharacterized protein n=1 Tax=Pistacia integerrima TaxID=434235 RepID=A0ACC0YR91_9ROSI|nr:hypothetical protein Pint_28337 [Pistacia integerrima]